jgi:hypothetical protein
MQPSIRFLYTYVIQINVLISSEWSGVGWLALNALVLLAGWMVLFIGLTRLVDRAT